LRGGRKTKRSFRYARERAHNGAFQSFPAGEEVNEESHGQGTVTILAARRGGLSFLDVEKVVYGEE